MTEIQGGGSGPVTPRQKEMYEQEYRHGTDLFQKALQQSAKSDNPYQKAEFQKVMDQAMVVLNQTAKGLKREDLEQQNQQIAADYKSYQQNPSDASRKKLLQDLNKAKSSIS